MYNSWVEISKSAILYNLKQYQKIVGKGVEVMPIVKSNAYGHGMIEVTKLILPKVKWLGVVSLGEALELRKHNVKKRIFVLSYAQSRYLKEGIKQNIDLPIYSLSYAKLISGTAKKLKKTAKVHIKIDTGTTRVGILVKDAVEFIKQVDKLPNIKIEGIYSHFAASEENVGYTKYQLKVFNQILKQVQNDKIKIPIVHFGCSAASLVEPQAHFNLIRLGLSLYGLWPSEQAEKIALKHYPWLSLKPALTWKTKVLQVKIISKGTKVGYGCSYTAPRRLKMAVIAVGYWEGYDRHLSNNGEVIVKNKKCPVIGRVCMNLTMIDVSKIKSIKAGDEVELVGKKNTADEMADKLRTINYEVVTRINSELERVYKK
tara:strand:- start:15948 stop:17063 length:1116 start_codon:yes stop_codon:yes gene_type:complete